MEKEFIKIAVGVRGNKRMKLCFGQLIDEYQTDDIITHSELIDRVRILNPYNKGTTVRTLTQLIKDRDDIRRIGIGKWIKLENK